MIKFSCPSCMVSIKAPDDAAGKTGRCRNCRAAILVPGPTDFDDVVSGPTDFDDILIAAGAHIPDDHGDDDDAASVFATVGPLVFDDEQDDSDSPMSPRPWRSGRQPSARSSDTESPVTGPPSSPMNIPPEPWYYGFLAFGAQAVLTIGIVSAAMRLYFVVVGEESAGVEPVALVIVCMAMASAAPTLLLVDLARNIRILRYKS